MYLLDNAILKAVCWTLIHSLWQGIAVALLAGVVISLTKKSPAALRYRLLTLLVAVFVVCVCVTLADQWPSDQSRQHAEITPVPAGTHVSSGALEEIEVFRKDPATVGQPSIIELTVNFLNENAAAIVIFWFLVFSIKCFRLLSGLQEIYRLRNYQTVLPALSWLNRFSELQALMKVSGKVRLLESRLARVPAVTGFLKPVILVPVGMLSNLPPEQVEAILLHELAHIRRRDYLYNLFQGFIDMVFFFNPGMLWVSSLIRDERENCCDDMAISVTRNKSEFVHALVSFQEYHLAGNALAMQFGAPKNHLLNRAKRILMNNNKSLNVLEKSVLSVCMIVAVVMSFAFSSALGPNDTAGKPTTARSASVKPASTEKTLYAERTYNPDEIPEGTSLKFNDVIDGQNQPTYLFKIQDTLYQISGDIRLFKVNGKIVPQEKMKAYLPIIRSLLHEHRRQEQKLERYITAADPYKNTPIVADPEPVAEIAEPVSSFRCEPSPIHEPNLDPLTVSILADLQRELVILDRNRLEPGRHQVVTSFKLSERKLIVNGIQQPEDLHRRIKEKYVQPNTTIYYNHEVTTED